MHALAHGGNGTGIWALMQAGLLKGRDETAEASKHRVPIFVFLSPSLFSRENGWFLGITLPFLLPTAQSTTQHDTAQHSTVLLFFIFAYINTCMHA